MSRLNLDLHDKIITNAKNRNIRNRKEANEKLGYVELHHIFPSKTMEFEENHWFIKQENNKVFLTFEEHCLVHLCLYVEFGDMHPKTNPFLMINKDHNEVKKFIENEINDIQEYLQLLEESRKNLSEYNKNYKDYSFMRGSNNWNYGGLTKEHKQKLIENRPDTSGKNNPMFGKERPDMKGENNPMKKEENKNKFRGSNNSNFGGITEEHKNNIKKSAEKRMENFKIYNPNNEYVTTIKGVKGLCSFFNMQKPNINKWIDRGPIKSKRKGTKSYKWQGYKIIRCNN